MNRQSVKRLSPKRLRLSVLVVPLLLTACASQLTKDFYVMSVDTGGREVKSLVEVGGRFTEAKKNGQFTPTTVTVTFEGADDAVSIQLHAVEVAPDGTERIPEQTEQSRYIRPRRTLYFDDAKNQLLIMVRNSEHRGP